MQRILLLLLCSIMLFGCKKDDSSNSNNGNYYFNCQIDGNNISIPFSVATSAAAANGIGAISSVGSQIYTQFSSSKCSTPNSYCLTLTIQLLGQKVGSYTASPNGYPFNNSFDLSLIQGSDTYIYDASSVIDINGKSGNVTVNITDIQHSTNSSTTNPNGYLKGSFSGTVLKTKIPSTGGTYNPVPISGNFYFPLN